MPTASAATYPRYGSYATTYGSSYNTSSVSSRSSSASRRRSVSNEYSNSPTTSYSKTRPLPPGPGPLDTTGRKLDGFTLADKNRSRVSHVTGLTSTNRGPLKADHSSTLATPSSTRYASFPDYSSGNSTLRRNSRTNIGLDPIATSTSNTSQLAGRRSASLANLNLTDDSSSYGIKTPNHNNINHEATSHRPNSRQRNNFDNDTGTSTNSRASGIGDEKKDSIARSPRYTTSISRESSPGTSNGYGSRSRHFGDAKEDSSSSKSLSRQSSSSSFTTNVS